MARAALVTGGAQGIGLAVARRLVEEGWRVLLLDPDEEAGREALELLGDGASFLPGDVGKERDVRAAARFCEEAFGRLDGLVNNAGIGLTKPLAEVGLDEWRRVLDVNLTGAFLCVRHALPLLRAARGAVVNVGSSRALMSEPDTEAYAASKGGLVALTHALAISLGPEVRVNAVSPGWIETAEWQKERNRRTPEHRPADRLQHPVGRVGRPEDVAEAVVYLLTDRSGFVTGQNLVVDGGMTRKMIYAD